MEETTTSAPVGLGEQPRHPLTGRFEAKPEADDTTPISFRVSLAVRQRLREFAAGKGVSLSCLMTLLVNQLLAGEVDLQDLPGPAPAPTPVSQAATSDPWNTPEAKPAPPPVDPMVELQKTLLAFQVEQTKVLQTVVSELGAVARGPNALPAANHSPLPAEPSDEFVLQALAAKFGTENLHVKAEVSKKDGRRAIYRLYLKTDRANRQSVNAFLKNLGLRSGLSRFPIHKLASYRKLLSSTNGPQQVLPAKVEVLPPPEGV